MKKLLLFAFLLCTALSWGQVGCEFSNVGPDSGLASINAATGQGFSAPGGIGAVGFRLPVACLATNFGFHVWNTDTSASSAPHTYDIGIYCVIGDCDAAGTNSNKLYAHLGAVFGTWFTNTRVAATYTGVSVASTSGTVLTLTIPAGTFNLQDFPPGIKITLSLCSTFNGTSNVNVSPVPTTASIAVTKTNAGGSATGCTAVVSAGYPASFASTATCSNASFTPNCMQGFRLVADARTVCAAIPCVLPSGLYAMAFGTDCSNATATSCAQLMGDEDFGTIYPFTVSCAGGCSPAYDSTGGLPATMTFTRSNTTAKWNTTPGTSAPIKAAKILIY